MSITVVVVSWNGSSWIENCVRSLLTQAQCPDLLVVDNASTDGTVEIVERFRPRFEKCGGTLTVHRLQTNTGFPRGSNRGIEAVLGAENNADAVLLLNQDAMLEPGCLEAFSTELRRNPQAGCIGAKNLYPDSGLIQHAGGFLEKPRMTGQHHGHNEEDQPGRHDTTRKVEFVTGASMLLRVEALQEVGLFNEVFSPGYYEDVELCDRFREHGWDVLFIPKARVLHHESSSFSDDLGRLRLAHRNRLIYLLPKLADPLFEKSFRSAEMDFLVNRATFEEQRAINGAALDLLSESSKIMRQRCVQDEIPPRFGRTLERVLRELRATCISILVSPQGDATPEENTVLPAPGDDSSESR